ncbi:MAG: winged helix-turn-helix domain-containing protein [Scandinavium sp.]|uniref:winged helix-turn-helix domain-containing protein n=1 Tax=Scandinavium sp. TaxID=2830653 RepID=UPI003F3E2457
MKEIYLINEIVLFSPQEGSLTPRHSWPAGRVTLHTPAAESLLLLMTHNGQPVPQKMFFEQVWERKGAVVSTNTLYQNIASIRKALRMVGLEEDIIRTLPKQGFQCTASVRTGELADFLPLPTANPSPEPTAEFPVPPPAGVTHLKLWAFSVLVSLLMVAGMIYWNISQQPVRKVSWFPAGTIENCTLYSSWSGAEYSQSMFDELRQKYPISCAKRTSIYLNVNRLQSGTTLILCNAPIEKSGTQCQSIMFQDENHEDR